MAEDANGIQCVSAAGRVLTLRHHVAAETSEKGVRRSLVSWGTSCACSLMEKKDNRLYIYLIHYIFIMSFGVVCTCCHALFWNHFLNANLSNRAEYFALQCQSCLFVNLILKEKKKQNSHTHSNNNPYF